MSQKLTNYLREQIINNAILAAFKDRDSELDAQEKSFANSIWDLLYGEHKEGFSRLPSYFFPKRNSIYVKFGEGQCSYGELRFGEEKIVPFGVSKGNAAAVFGAGTPEEIDFSKLERKRERIQKEKTELKQKLTALLLSVSTVNKLVSIWPEAMDYMPESSKPKSNLPTVTVDEIRQSMAKAKKG